MNDITFSQIQADKLSALTNGDRIRAMTDEDLAEIFGKNVHCDNCMMYFDQRCPDGVCAESWLNWLKQPVGGENDTD